MCISTRRRGVCLALCLALLTACGNTAAASAAPAAQSAEGEQPEPTPPADPYRAPALALSEFHQDAAIGTAAVGIDVSCVSQGYVAVSATGDARLKFQVECGGTKYNYDLPGDGTPASFPLQMGDGTYSFRVLENTSGTKYAVLYETSADAAGAVRVESRPGGDALVLDDGSGYVTRLYADHGALVEEYAAADTDYMPAAAEKVADTRTFTVVQDGAQYIITTDDGEVHVTLHSAGRADE